MCRLRFHAAIACVALPAIAGCADAPPPAAHAPAFGTYGAATATYTPTHRWVRHVETRHATHRTQTHHPYHHHPAPIGSFRSITETRCRNGDQGACRMLGSMP